MLPVHHHSADYIVWSFGITGFILSYLENIILLKPTLGGVVSAGHFIAGHENTQLNRVCYFVPCLISKASNFPEFYLLFVTKVHIE